MEDLNRLSSLSRELSLSSTKPIPEEYIRQTLLAHGFFTRAESLSSNSKTSIEKATNIASKSKEKLTGCGITEEDKKRTTQLISHMKEGKEVHRLKEPRRLFSKPPSKVEVEPKSLSPYWPIEVECLPRRQKFVGAPPPISEPFYVPEHDVVSPKIRSGDGNGTTVYLRPRGPEKYFTVARPGPSRSVRSSSSGHLDESTLKFESRFESGNLAKAVQVGKWDYELYLSYDLYTNKHTQWFYFSVKNMRKGQTYRFTIVNLYKAGSLYNEGMQPVMYSVVEGRTTGIGWRRKGHNIKYFKTPLRRVDTKSECYYFGLTWSHTFEYQDDTCYFAHCYPYTYTDLQEYLQSILSNSTKAEYCKQRTLCHTLAGNPVPLLTITSPTKSPEENLAKRAVVLSSRVHPGETNGSWMMKGLLDFLTGGTADAKTLRDSFVFKIVPMLNPDGVIVGNYRCSLAGRDLNRNYRTKLKDSYPTIWHMKAMVKKLCSEREVVMYCDLHGHSRKQNVFIYGCDTMDDQVKRLRSRIFPKMLSKNALTMFSYKSSRFGVHKSKEGTGRVVMWREMGITNSYTMEATFCGSLLGNMAGLQFKSVDLERMGYQLCDTILDYCDPDQSKVEHILRQLEDDYRLTVLSHLASLGQSVPPGVDPLDVQLPDQLDMESSDAGSDSSESDGPPVHYLAKDRRRKKKKLKSRRERNKRKAILKLSHFAKGTAPHSGSGRAPSLPPPPTLPSSITNPSNQSQHTDKKKSMTDMLSPLGGLGENPKNGGVPMFVQERLEERKRRSDTESTEILVNEHVVFHCDNDYIDTVAMDYLKQGIPPHLSEVDPRSSLSSLSRTGPGCPISITPMAICDVRPPSRASSRTSLPQLVETRSHGAFTSQYLANHLQDVMSCQSPPDQSTSTSHLPMDNNTRNLANLSRLFRQLRPHLVNSERHAQRANHAKSPEKVKERINTPKTTSKVEFHSFTGNISRSESSRQLIPRDHHNSINSKQLMRKLQQHVATTEADRDFLPPIPSTTEVLESTKPHPQPRPLSRQAAEESVVQSQESGSFDLPPMDTSPQQQTLIQSQAQGGGGTSIEPQSSHSSLGGGGGGRASSSLTNSWESFSKPIKLSGRKEPKGAEGSTDSGFLEKLPQPYQPRPSSSGQDTYLKMYRPERQPSLSSLPKPSPTPNQQTNPLTPISEHTPYFSRHSSKEKRNIASSVIEHKRHVSEAVDHIHSDKKRRNAKKKKHQKEERASKSEDDNCSRSKEFMNLMRNTDHTPFTAEPHPLITSEELSSRSSFISTGKPGEVARSLYGWAKISAPIVGGGSKRKEAEPVGDEDPEYFSELTDNINRKSKYSSSAQTTRMFSSKPPSRVGNKPPPPTTDQRGKSSVIMALAVSGHEQARPATHHSFRKPRPLLSRAHSRNSGTFSDNYS